jgi:tripartite-type tricarboxylate transporter receptor subunit TctC
MSLARRRLILGCAAAAVNAVAVPSWADPSSNIWPNKIIAILVPFPAGGSHDLSARLLADHLKTVLGQPVVVENKPGAGGNLAAAEAARAQGDGHTLFIGTNGTQTINQRLYPASVLRLRLPRRSLSGCAHSSTPYWGATLLSSG